MSDRVGSLREVNRIKNRSRARLGFVESIRNGLTKKQNLIENRPSRMETGLPEEENGNRFHKEE